MFRSLWCYGIARTSHIFLILCILISDFLAAQILPTDVLQNGYAIVSCFADSASEPAVAVIDMRQAGTLHDNTANHGAIDLSANFPKTRMWTLSDFADSQILALAIDKRDGSIYAASSKAYEAELPLLSGGDGRVYHISPDGNTVTLFAILPGGVSGGWMDIDENHNQLYYSNFDDGMIYIVPISAGPAIPNTFAYSTFSPFPSQQLDDLIAPLGQRIWSVGYNPIESRLYYSIWAQDTDQSSGLTNDIRSIAIDANGNFLPATDQFELTAPIDNFSANGTSYNTNMPVSDIEFNVNGTKMLLAEQSFNSIVPSAGSHDSRVLEYNGSAGAWMPEPISKHDIGELVGFNITTNARGGVDFLYHDIDANNNVNGDEDYIVATGDALPLDRTAQIFIYGLQIHRITGGDQNTSIKVDLDGSLSGIEDKYIYGDIDVRVAPNCVDKCIRSYGAFNFTKRRVN